MFFEGQPAERASSSDSAMICFCFSADSLFFGISRELRGECVDCRLLPRDSMHTIDRNCDLRVHLEEGDPLELRSCQVLQVSCVCSNADRSHTCSLNLCCRLKLAHIRFNQLWRQHVHHDKHGTARRKSTKCEATLSVCASCGCVWVCVFMC